MDCFIDLLLERDGNTMHTEYTDEDLLQLSGIQHFMFCRRQWALIYIEDQWVENHLTYEGHALHERVDDPHFTESRNSIYISRAVPVKSYKLGVTGICDLVEFTEDDNGALLPQKGKRYKAFPVEYKRGKPKREPVDEVQLCAQAICLEEMLSIPIAEGALYYAQTRHREPVVFTDNLRNMVQSIAKEMHDYYKRNYTPKVKPSKSCKACSLKDICLPEILDKRTVSTYIAHYIETLINEKTS